MEGTAHAEAVGRGPTGLAQNRKEARSQSKRRTGRSEAAESHSQGPYRPP